MEGFRTILLLIGAAVVAGVWWWSTRRAGPQQVPRARAEPNFGSLPREVAHDAKGRAADHPEFDPDTTAPRAVQAQASATLRAADDAAAEVAAAAPPRSAEVAEVFGDEPARVPAIASTQAEARIERGEPGPGFDPTRDMILSLFVLPAVGEAFLGAEVVETLGGAQLHFGARQVFHRHAPDGRSMYCVANMVEPGTLEPGAIRFEHVPGLLFFAVLPGPRSGTDTFADMIATARRVAQRLRGELADADRSSLTPQTIQHLRERVVEFERLRGPAEG